MKEILIRVMDVITKINKSMVWIIGTLVFLMCVMLTVDVLLRYLFNSPTAWAFELATWGTGIIGFMLGGYALAIGQHVRVDVFFERLTIRQQSMVEMISSFFLFLMAISLIWLGFDYVTHYYNIGAIATGGMEMPLWIKWLIVPLGGLLIALQGIVKLINDLYIIFTGEKIYETEEEM
ncbi:TRAP transporter small permease subunit [Mesobacillus harenae]|uniref:TRAP transporter small permease subunit n=1 Tax=Mesobacillus harenae TaxID=2213203 RepID=UPI0015806CD3|nr:TRAP transporter small permease subunit [Mesobacillus harenae]